MSAMKTTEQFIKEALALNPTYDYSKVVYKGNKVKVLITCDKGHEFMQSPNKHLRGQKCPKCFGSEKLTTDEFIRRSVAVHGDKYDYRKTVYKDSTSKVTIICPIHGEFEQVAGSHLLGFGCHKCGRDTIRRKNEDVISELKSIYGDRYGFEKVEWKGREARVIVVCPKHGEVKRTVRYLLRGGRCCTKCYHESQRLTKEEFVERARETHGDSFDYSEVEYVNSQTPVKLTCRKGHTFFTKPMGFLYSASGCPVCQSEKRSSGERRVRWFLTQCGIEFEEQKRFPDCRYKQLLRFDFYIPSENACIEFQGRQHYPGVRNNFGWFADYKNISARDNVKRQYCASHGIKLIEIRYDESVPKRLKEEFPNMVSNETEKRFDKLRTKGVRKCLSAI